MNRQLRYIAVIVGLLGLLLIMELLLPKPIRWDRTLSSDDKIPYGTFAFRESMQSAGLPGASRSRTTFFEMPDTVSRDVLVITPIFSNGKEDCDALLHLVENGNRVIIAAATFDSHLTDTLHISTKDILQREFEQTGNPIEQDSSYISWRSEKYFYPEIDNAVVFDALDSTWNVLATHEDGNPMMVSKRIGEGSLILSSNPWIFSNLYVLGGNAGLVRNVLGLVSAPLLWTEFYSRGRQEPQTPLRYILSVPALRWAYYVLMGTLIVFIVFETKRRQRPIPVVLPPKNESLSFSTTLGNLYFEQGNHKKIAKKMVAYLRDHIRTKYYLAAQDDDSDFIQRLSHKSGKPQVNVQSLFVLIGIIESKARIDEAELSELNKKIDAFLAD